MQGAAASVAAAPAAGVRPLSARAVFLFSLSCVALLSIFLPMLRLVPRSLRHTLQRAMQRAMEGEVGGLEDLDVMEDDVAPADGASAAAGNGMPQLFDAVLEALAPESIVQGEVGDDPLELELVDSFVAEALPEASPLPWRFELGGIPAAAAGAHSEVGGGGAWAEPLPPSPSPPRATPHRASPPPPPHSASSARSPSSSAAPPSRSRLPRASSRAVPFRGRPPRVPRKRSGPSPASFSCPAGRRYLHLLSAREGMSAWTHIVYEALAMAADTGRALVEPCVAGGMLLPCTPGRVLPVPEGPGDTDWPTTAQDDALAVGAFAEQCLGPEAAGKRAAKAELPPGIVRQRGRTYPLGLYMDMPALRRASPRARIISFAEWVHCELEQPRRRGQKGGTGRGGKGDARDLKGASDPKDDDANGTALSPQGLIQSPLGYCVSKRAGADADVGGACRRHQVGAYRFARVWQPGETPRLTPAARLPGVGHLFRSYRATFLGDAGRDMFLYEVWRGFWRPFGAFRRVPAFNPIHAAAVAAWVRERLALPVERAQHYAVFNWRSEGVPDASITSCARKLAFTTAPTVQELLSQRWAVVLTADLPSPINPCRAWYIYAGSAAEGGERRLALETLADAGLLKYDDDHPALDAGVLSIRDWILSLNAGWFVTCHGARASPGEAACSPCFRTRSKYVERILNARAKAGRASFTRWLDMKGVKVGAASSPDESPSQRALPSSSRTGRAAPHRPARAHKG